MNNKLALMPLLIASAFAYAADESSDTVTVNQTELQQVEVKGDNTRVRAAKSYSIASDGDLRDRVNLGLLGKANAFTAPITVVNYDEKSLNNTEARTLVDAVAKNDASTWQFGGETNTLQGIYVRGMQLDARQFSVNGLAGMYAYQSSPTAAVESAQLIKGASSAINGMDPEGAVAGSVNIETKKASEEGNRKIGLGYFSDSRAQGSVDLGQRFGENKEWGVRVNSKLRHGDTPRDGYGEDNKEFALNADYNGGSLRVSFDSMYSKRKTTGGRARFQDLQNLDFALPAAPDGSTNLVPSWQAQTTRDQTNMLTFEYDFESPVQLFGGIGYNESRYFGNFAQLQARGEDGTYRVGSGTRNGSRLSDQTAKTLSLNVGARGEFETGAVSHNWSTAYDRVKRNRKNYWGSAYTPVLTTNIYNPVWSSSIPALPPLSATASVDSSYIADSLAVSDTMAFSDGRYRLTLGGRFQRIKQENRLDNTSGSAHRFSPMAMFAWRPTTDLVAYGNYMEDLEPGELDSETGSMADPKVSKQFEIGVRKNWGNWVTSLNAFQISRPGYWRGNSSSGTDFAAMKAAGLARAGAEQGKERNRGIELNAYANLLNQTLRPSFGIMYLKSDLIDYPTYSDNLSNGDQVSSPRIVAKAGIEWDTPFVKGLTLNGGIQHYGKSYQDTARQYKLPSYTLVDVGARYKAKLGKNELIISTAVENLFNKNYWQVQRGQYDRSFAVLGMPRTYWLKAEYSF